MPRKKQENCSNCKGTNPKCNYLTNGRKCRKGQAIGKAKGKAISEKTKLKRELYDAQLGDLHTDYLNEMANRQIKAFKDEETGKINHVNKKIKLVSFEKWLTNNGHKNLSAFFRRHYQPLEDFNFKDLI